MNQGPTPCHVCSSRQAPVAFGASDPGLLDRREFLWRFGGGLGGIALAHLLGAEGLLADAVVPRTRAALNG
ncbi:MAG TPA: hypothetical protein VKA81_06765, partial [Verrucomicrobiae bacterium]|nr:hypothetical protein [Verrucomicrobiae bacterium]